MEERETGTMEQLQPVDHGESVFFRGVLRGSIIGFVVGIALGIAIALVARLFSEGIEGPQMLGIVVGTLAGGVFLGLSVACGLHIKDLGVEQRFEEDPGAPGSGTPV